MRNRILLLISLLLFFFGAFAQEKSGKLSPMTRQFLLEKSLSSSSQDSTFSTLQRVSLRKTGDIEYVNCIIQLHNTSQLDDLKDLGVQVNTVLSSMITAQVPVNRIEAVAALPNVARVEISRKVQKKLDGARASASVNQVQQGNSLPNGMPFTGKGVVVGILDNGFEYGHINFYDTTGNVLRVKRVWNQNARSGTAPANYSYGAEYNTEIKILSAARDYTDETHATHVTGIAAGAYRGLNYWGVAPESDIVMVSIGNDDNDLIDGINYVYNYAQQAGKPAVVNMSLGTHLGPHDGTSAFDVACDELQGAGKLLVGAAGNEGNDRLHISKTFSAITDTLKTFFSTPSSVAVDVWGTANTPMYIQYVIINKQQNKVLYASDFFNASQNNGNGTTIRLQTSNAAGGTGRLFIQTETNPLNNKPNALLQTSADFSLGSGNYLGIKIVSAIGTTIHAWDIYGSENSTYFTAASMNGWQNGDTDYTVGEIGGTGKKIISAGSYASKNSFKQYYGGGTHNTGEPLNVISYFSSKGPAADQRTKPDITAPGSILISSYNSSVSSSSSGYYGSMVSNRVTVNSKNYYFGAMEGTSMATPFVSGVLALWLQANPQLTPEGVRTIFSQTATTDSYTGTTPNNNSGYGKIDAWAGILNILGISAASENTINQKFIRTNIKAGNLEIIFNYTDKDVKIYLTDMNGKLIVQKNMTQVAENQSATLAANLAGGIYLIYISGQEKQLSEKVIFNP